MFLEVLLRTQSTNERIESSVFAKPNSFRNHPFNRLTRITNCFLCTSLSINSSHICTLHLHVHMLKELLTNSLHIGTLDLNVHMYRELLGRLLIDDDSVRGVYLKQCKRTIPKVWVLSMLTILIPFDHCKWYIKGIQSSSN